MSTSNVGIPACGGFDHGKLPELSLECLKMALNDGQPSAAATLLEPSTKDGATTQRDHHAIVSEAVAAAVEQARQEAAAAVKLVFGRGQAHRLQPLRQQRKRPSRELKSAGGQCWRPSPRL